MVNNGHCPGACLGPRADVDAAEGPTPRRSVSGDDTKTARASRLASLAIPKRQHRCVLKKDAQCQKTKIETSDHASIA